VREVEGWKLMLGERVVGEVWCDEASLRRAASLAAPAPTPHGFGRAIVAFVRMEGYNEGEALVEVLGEEEVMRWLEKAWRAEKDGGTLSVCWTKRLNGKVRGKLIK